MLFAGGRASYLLFLWLVLMQALLPLNAQIAIGVVVSAVGIVVAVAFRVRMWDRKM